MSIAGEVVQELQLTKDGEVGSGTEDILELGQGRDFVAQEVFAKGLGIKRERAHNVRVPIAQAF